MTTIRVSILRGGAIEKGGAELIDSWRREGDEKLWVDIQDPTRETLEPLLEQRFGFHELAAEDSLSPNTLPKYDPFPDYDFFIFRAVDVNLNVHASQTYKLAAFLGRNFLFTVHRQEMTPVDDVCNRLPSDARILSNGCDYLCTRSWRGRVAGGGWRVGLPATCYPPPANSRMRRQSMPQRELLNQISRGDAQFIQPQHLIYFRDIYDHMFRISETIDGERDMMAGTMEAYLSVVANRTNEIMKILTIFSAIMLPLTLIAGIYGIDQQPVRRRSGTYDGVWRRCE